MRTRVFLFGCCCLGWWGLVHAEPGSSALQRQLHERDMVIRDLQQRVEALERLLRVEHSTPPPLSPPGDSPSAPRDEEDETARALERALVREGGLLLPAGSFEVEPRLQYTYRAARGVGIVATPAGAQITNQEINQDRLDGTLGLRVGLSRTSQAEIRVPYVWTRQTSSAAALALSESERQSGLGDVEVQITKQFVGERAGMPALLGSLNLKTTTGEFESGRLALGSGFPSLQAAVTAVKRQDPLVFVGGASYTAYRPRSFGGNNIDPGNGIGFRFSTILAASPETSLRAGLDFTRYGRTRLNGTPVPGSDLVSAIIEFGLSTLVSPRTLLDFSVGFGVTPDAPSLRIGMSLPIRFY